MINKLLRCVAISLAIVGIAHAADQHGHDHKPPHGGVLAAAGEIDYELVAKAEALTLYVVEHDKPLATAGGKASATIFTGSEKTVVTLEPASNTFVAKGNFKTGLGVRVAIVVTLPGKPETKLSFRLK